MEIKYFWEVKGIARKDKIKNEDLRKEIKLESILEHVPVGEYGKPE